MVSSRELGEVSKDRAAIPAPDAPLKNYEDLGDLLWEVGAYVDLMGEAALAETPLTLPSSGMLMKIHDEPGITVAHWSGVAVIAGCGLSDIGKLKATWAKSSNAAGIARGTVAPPGKEQGWARGVWLPLLGARAWMVAAL